MSLFDIVFWLLIALIAVLAYSIESGISVRHRKIVLSSILSATAAAIVMMFVVEDNSSFGTGDPPEQEKKKQQVAAASRNTGGDGGEGERVVERADGGKGSGGGMTTRYVDGEKLNRPGGFRDCPVCPLMIMVDAGTVVVGSPEGELDRHPNEGPQVEVRIADPFTVSRYEIQVKEFTAFVDETGHQATAGCVAGGQTHGELNWLSPGFPQSSADHPVVCISNNDARAYTKWLSAKTDRNYRLLSESEWEYVARGGRTTPYWVGHKITAEQAYFAGKAPGTSRVGQYPPNGAELFDTAGNVWEMTADCWAGDLSQMSRTGRPLDVMGTCPERTVRGGGWTSPMGDLRSAARRPARLARGYNDVGLRVARDIK